eukprot:CAMPEP_0119320994 /NCGR_PEP_ID=MMETSP1333-20130426/54103_1 /TAXON_ID=418940 /ORGANISM="Scyphosphaera apsteinii, Strain RCC1455" /LENGTH=425 /DNA_ID=CAMNT_0007327849 /DNA_START=407 /DNA_END=1684 /DNA_ORIENTATION=-
MILSAWNHLFTGYRIKLLQREVVLLTNVVFAAFGFANIAVLELQSGTLLHFFVHPLFAGFCITEAFKNLIYSLCAFLCIGRIGAYQELAKVHSANADAVRLSRGLARLKASMLICSTCFLLRTVMLIIKQVSLHDLLVKDDPIPLFTLRWFALSDILPRVVPLVSFMILMRNPRRKNRIDIKSRRAPNTQQVEAQLAPIDGENLNTPTASIHTGTTLTSPSSMPSSLPSLGFASPVASACTDSTLSSQRARPAVPPSGGSEMSDATAEHVAAIDPDCEAGIAGTTQLDQSEVQTTTLHALQGLRDPLGLSEHPQTAPSTPKSADSGHHSERHCEMNLTRSRSHGCLGAHDSGSNSEVGASFCKIVKERRDIEILSPSKSESEPCDSESSSEAGASLCKIVEDTREVETLSSGKFESPLSPEKVQN